MYSKAELRQVLTEVCGPHTRVRGMNRIVSPVLKSKRLERQQPSIIRERRWVQRHLVIVRRHVK